MISLWKFYDEELKESLQLNKKNAEDITRLKVRSLLADMRPFKRFTVLIGVLWVVFLDFIIVKAFHIAGPFFLISAMIQSLLTTLAIFVYIYHLVLIDRVDIDQPVIDTQENIARIESSTLWVTRLLFLQLPVWSTFFYNTWMWHGAAIWQKAIMITIPLLLTGMAIWLFVNIRRQNMEKKWFRMLFQGPEWTPLRRAADLLRQIHEYRTEA